MNNDASCNNDTRTMTSDDDLQRRFDSAKTAIDLESGSAAAIKGRAARRTRRSQLVSGAAVVAVVALAGLFAVRSVSDEPDFELVTAAPTIEAAELIEPTSVEPTAVVDVPTTLPTPVETSTVVAPLGGVIFETDFSQDTGYEVGFTNLWNGGENAPVDPPRGWDGVRVGTLDGGFSVISGEGVDDSNALRVAWGGDSSQPSVSLGKHLTGDETTGYDELYVRYRVRLPNNFRAGAGDGNFGTWMWGRLWQNTSVDRSGPNGWTENRADAGYVAFSFNNGIPFTSASATWSENTGDNLGQGSGPRQRVDWFVSGSEPSTQPGYFESLWDLNTTDRPGQLENNTSQRWHTVEYHFKLASTPTSDDGVFEVFFDGVSQGNPTVLAAEGGAPERSGIPTTNLGSGFNFLTFFDHTQLWNEQWSDPDVEGFIWVNDVVVSTDRIGPDYSPGN